MDTVGENCKVGGLVVPGCLEREKMFSALFFAAGDWVKKGIVPHGVVGPLAFLVCWPLLAGLWRAIALLMKPWCVEEDVPAAANLNLHRGWNSRVGWHCDDEPLFGECGEAKLIVSMSLGTSALFKWKGKSCPDSEAHLCCLGHGDSLVMDGQCQDEFLHCTDPRSGTGAD